MIRIDENTTERQKAFFALQKVTELMNVCSTIKSPTVSKNLSDLRIELTQILTRLTIEEKNSIITEIDTNVPEINLGEIL